VFEDVVEELPAVEIGDVAGSKRSVAIGTGNVVGGDDIAEVEIVTRGKGCGEEK
jgi:hypothetical protein